MFHRDSPTKNEERASLGFSPEDYAPEDVAANDIVVQPDTLQPVLIFIDLMTQWRVGTAGPYGLDYSAIPPVMDMREVPKGERGELFDDLRVMENAALERIRSKT